jgi:hypothetical protein
VIEWALLPLGALGGFAIAEICGVWQAPRLRRASEAKTTTGLLTDHGIATPTAILAAMIELEIAKLPAQPSAPWRGQGVEKLKLRNGREIHVRIFNSNGDTSIFPENWRKVSIGMPGSPQYRSVELTEQESVGVVREMRRYRERSVAAHRQMLDSNNQQDALGIVEELICPLEEESVK